MDMDGEIRQAFKASGMTIQRLALRAEVPYASAHGFFTGDADPRLSTVAKLCRVLGLELRPAWRRAKKE